MRSETVDGVDLVLLVLSVIVDAQAETRRKKIGSCNRTTYHVVGEQFKKKILIGWQSGKHAAVLNSNQLHTICSTTANLLNLIYLAKEVVENDKKTKQNQSLSKITIFQQRS